MKYSNIVGAFLLCAVAIGCADTDAESEPTAANNSTPKLTPVEVDIPNTDTSLTPVSTVLPVGAQLPALTADGWLNGDAPLADDLKDKIVVVDVWAYW